MARLEFSCKAGRVQGYLQHQRRHVLVLVKNILTAKLSNVVAYCNANGKPALSFWCSLGLASALQLNSQETFPSTTFWTSHKPWSQASPPLPPSGTCLHLSRAYIGLSVPVFQLYTLVDFHRITAQPALLDQVCQETALRPLDRRQFSSSLP